MQELDPGCDSCCPAAGATAQVESFRVLRQVVEIHQLEIGIERSLKCMPGELRLVIGIPLEAEAANRLVVAICFGENHGAAIHEDKG